MQIKARAGCRQGAALERAGAQQKPPRAAGGLPNPGPSPAFHLPTSEGGFPPPPITSAGLKAEGLGALSGLLAATR